MLPARNAYDRALKLSSQGRHLEAISCFEEALKAEPNDTRTLFALGNTARALGLAEPAAQFFRKVLALEPERVEALVNLANLLRTQGQFEAAALLLEPALARNPNDTDLRLTLGSVFREAGDHPKAREQYGVVLALEPNHAAALSNLADLLTDDRDFEAAAILYDRAVKMAPLNPQARLNRAVLHFLAGNLKDAWRDYGARAQLPGKVPASELRLPDWRGEPLKRTRLLVRAEQGVGDQTMFMSLMPDLLQQAETGKGSVILECEPRLVSLAERSFPGATVKPQMLTNMNGIPTAEYGWLKVAGGANAVTLMGSLPRWLRGDLESFPAKHVFLMPDPQERKVWREKFGALGGSPVIGICWRSGKSGGHRSAQYAPPQAWGAFLRELPGAIVSAQYDASPQEITALEEMSGRTIFVPPFLDQKNELDRTAAMLSELDMLISAPTAVSWLGAGAGTRTLKLLYDTSWTAFGQTYEPLAPSCQCVMPKVRGDWTDVFAQAAAVIARA
ncbi:MAG TPA: tetratricopeptide repeat protein [Rhizomicrobium sp.]|jgi:Flp pilus assembly protein TadD|nr:tetratricopeptide repeat protein [Rhizomicrobium sp.]